MLIFHIIFLTGLAVHTYTDLRYYLLYNSVSAVLFLAGLAYSFTAGVLADACLGVAACAGVLLTLYFASNGGMGEGDVKLAPALGAWLGLEQGLLMLLAAFVGGGAVGGLLLLAGRKRKDLLPFGPFLCMGALLAFYWGAKILHWYWAIMY